MCWTECKKIFAQVFSKIFYGAIFTMIVKAQGNVNILFILQADFTFGNFSPPYLGEIIIFQFVSRLYWWQWTCRYSLFYCSRRICMGHFINALENFLAKKLRFMNFFENRFRRYLTIVYRQLFLIFCHFCLFSSLCNYLIYWCKVYGFSMYAFFLFAIADMGNFSLPLTFVFWLVLAISLPWVIFALSLSL